MQLMCFAVGDVNRCSVSALDYHIFLGTDDGSMHGSLTSLFDQLEKPPVILR